VDDALYASLCRTMRALCLEVQATQSPSGPLLLEWQSWARVFVAGLYHRESAVRAALSAGWEAILLEMDDPEAGQFGHAAADLAWAAVHLAEGEHEMAEALAHAARQRVATLLDIAVELGRSLDAQRAGRTACRAPSAASEPDADPVTHARLLIERYGPTTAAEMAAFYAAMSGGGYWRSVSAKIKAGAAR